LSVASPLLSSTIPDPSPLSFFPLSPPKDDILSDVGRRLQRRPSHTSLSHPNSQQPKLPLLSRPPLSSAASPPSPFPTLPFQQCWWLWHLASQPALRHPICSCPSSAVEAVEADSRKSLSARITSTNISTCGRPQRDYRRREQIRLLRTAHTRRR
jgi:hypothetical protein